MPPSPSGVAGRSAEIVARLRGAYEIDVFVDRPIPGLPWLSAHDFVWKHLRDPYDLIVYQLGNSRLHDFLWAYLLRYPGLVVLHDTHLHHARAGLLLRQQRADDYRREFVFNHPGCSSDLAELAVAGFDSSLYHFWPMLRTVVRSARLVAVHNTRVAGDLAAAFPGAAIEALPIGEGVPVDAARERAARTAIRTRYGLDPGTVLFGCFGGVTPEKRVPEILAALGSTIRYVPKAHLLLAGAAPPYFNPRDAARALGLEARVTITGYLDDEQDLTDHIAACDACLNLRWPTVQETSGPWLRCLAAGKPTIVTDLAHQVDVPALDPRNWSVLSATATGGAGEVAPVCIAVDIMDEDHSLRLAMRRLGSDPALRDRLGARARAWWAAAYTVEAMLAGYERAIARARERPAAVALEIPAGRDWRRVLDRTLAELGVPQARLFASDAV